MAEINVESGLVLGNEDQAIKVAGFLAAQPMPQIPDPEWVDPGEGAEPIDRIAPIVDKYATTKLWLEEWLKKLQTRKLLRVINTGIDILNRESTQGHITSL